MGIMINQWPASKFRKREDMFQNSFLYAGR
jgi:hypothetical protein